MRFRHRFFAIILLFVMILNIFRYQIPYIEYNLFKSYIAKNLCVKKEIKGNCCQGKCFLKKQIKMVEDTGNTNENNTNKKIQNDDVKDFLYSHTVIPKPIERIVLSIAETVTVKTLKYVTVIFIPPKYFTCF